MSRPAEGADDGGTNERGREHRAASAHGHGDVAHDKKQGAAHERGGVPTRHAPHERRHVPAHAARRRRGRRLLVGALIAIVAAGAGVGAAVVGARWSDAREEVLPPPVTSPAQQLPVLVPAEGSAESATGGEYGLEPYDAATSAAVLAAWGVTASASTSLMLADDSIATDGAVPHVTPCDDCDGTQGIVLGGRHDPPANSVHLLAYPRPEDGLADECGFTDVDEGELPIAIVTGNPGEIELRVGADRYLVESDDDERDEWEAWLDGPAGPRPPGSFVAHCIAVAAPTGEEPVVVRVSATDGTALSVDATIALLPQRDSDRLPIVLRPLDGSLLAVEVPLATTASTASVTTGSVEGGCDEAGDGPTGWRPGSEAGATASALPEERPYLAEAPATLRRVLALPEGEPTLVCIDGAGGSTAIVVTPPDARRLTLSVTDADAAVSIEGTFATIGWTACRGDAAVGTETVLCESGGDTGAIEAAGGLLDVTVRTGSSESTTRIPLSAVSGGPAREVYRLATPGGTVEITAGWDEGATGAGDAWLFDAAA